MIKKVSFCGILSALAIIVSVLESYVPIQALVALPGVKLGISNCLLLFVLHKFGFLYAFSVMITKCFVVSLLFNGFSGFMYSILGGILSIVVMYYALKLPLFFSTYGVSVLGAAFHNIGQILAAVLLLKSVYIINYLPVLLFASIFTGVITGIISKILIDKVKV